MNGLFVRLYGLVVLAIVLVMAAGIAVGVLALAPSRNAALSEIVAPALRQVVARIDQGEEPKDVFADYVSTMGPTLAMLPAQVVELTDQDLRHLKNGDVIVTGSELGRSAYAWSHQRDQVVEWEMLGVQTTAMQWSTQSLLGHATEPLPSTVKVESVDVRRLSPHLQARLAWRIAAIESPTIPLPGFGERVYVNGPVPGTVMTAVIPRRGSMLPWAILVGTFLATGLAVLMPLVPLRRKLIALGNATDRLRGGDLSARVAIDRGSGPVHEVSTHFNAMADRVQTLLGEHEALLQSVSHELRTPIARLLFSLDLLDGTNEPEERAALTTQMRDTVLEARTLTQELLTFTRLGEGAPALTTEPVDLAEIIDDIAARWEGTRVERADLAALVLGDSRLLYRALDNLAKNAVRYASPPVIRLEHREGAFALHVDDEGPGIVEADRARILEPFVRLEASRSKDTGGTGLGLAIVRRIVVLHGGTLTVGVSPEGGARFEICLPAQG